MRFAVYGAAGATGRMVTSELDRAGVDYVGGGRDDPPEKLLTGCAVVINCAPAVATGEPLIRAALDAGVHYVDAAGEQPFIRTVFERYGEDAAGRGVALVPALGF